MKGYYNDFSISQGELIGILIVLAIWLYLLIYSCRKKGWLGFFLCLFLPFLGAIFVAMLPEDQKPDPEEKFRCGICLIEFKKELLGGQTIREGKLCVFCLDKRQRGER